MEPTTSYIKRIRWWKWALLLIAAFLLAEIGYGLLMGGFMASDYIGASWLTIVVTAIILGLYAVFVKLFEKHWPTDLSLRQLVPHTLLGLLVG